MADKRIISDISPSAALGWTFRQEAGTGVFPPAVCLINGGYFLLSGFDRETDEYFMTDAKNIASAINASVDIYGCSSLNTVELANIAVLCREHGTKPEDINIFEQRGIRGRQSMETLEQAAAFSEEMKKYISRRDIPLKTLHVYSKLAQDRKNAVDRMLAKKDLSTGDFRKLVNLLFDMSGKDADLSADNLVSALSGEKDKARLDFMKDFNAITSGLPLRAESDDSFETGAITFTFRADTAEKFMEIIAAAEKCGEQIEKLFRFLDEQNIS